jgi:hypothetical protein
VTPAPTDPFAVQYYAKKDNTTSGPAPAPTVHRAPAGRRQEGPLVAGPRGPYYSQLQFTAPNVGEDIKQLPAMVFIEGPFRSSASELILIASDASTMSFYNPKPLVTGVSRTEMRREGCARLTLFGQGFSNAPLPTVHMLSDDSANARFVLMRDAEVLSDTELAFTLPFADVNNFTSTYAGFTQGQWDTHYPLVLYPAGLSKPEERSDVAAAAYIRFIETCPGSITPCVSGHTDDWACPVQPMCGCNSRGACVMNAGQQPMCSCDPFFNGTMCRQCIAGRYGKECLACDCGHGKCELNSVDGSCTCDEWWMGSKCNINKLGVGIGVGVSAAVLLLIAVCLLIRFLMASRAKKREAKKAAGSSGSRSKSRSRSLEMPPADTAAAPAANAEPFDEATQRKHR